MRYILLLAALWCCSISGKAQTDSVQVKKPLYSVRKSENSKIQWNNKKTKAEILSDEVDGNGMRHIDTSERLTDVYKGENDILVNLKAFANENDTVYKINCRLVSSKFEPNMKENSPMLLKLGDGTRLQLNVDFVYLPLPHIMVMYGVTIRTYTLYFSAKISREEIGLLTAGLSKIRLEVNHAPFDVELKKDNISQFLIDEYNLINDCLKESKTFYDDF